MQVARRIRRTPVASAKKFFDFSVIIGIILGGYYLASHDWSKYSNLLKIRVENADALHGFVGGLGNSQYIRGVAFNTFKRKPKNRGEFLGKNEPFSAQIAPEMTIFRRSISISAETECFRGKW